MIRGLHDAHSTQILRVTFAWHMRQIHAGCASHPRIRRKCCVHQSCRAPRAQQCMFTFWLLCTLVCTHGRWLHGLPPAHWHSGPPADEVRWLWRSCRVISIRVSILELLRIPRIIKKVNSENCQGRRLTDYTHDFTGNSFLKLFRARFMSPRSYLVHAWSWSGLSIRKLFNIVTFCRCA
jgi:hypothetical protein